VTFESLFFIIAVVNLFLKWHRVNGPTYSIYIPEVCETAGQV